MENRLWCQNYDILSFWRGKTILWRQIWRQISWNSQKCHSNDVRMPTNDRIELKTCMDTYFHPRNAMVVSEYLYFDLMKAKTILWRQIWRQISWNSQNVIQMMLECQQMIELSWKLVWLHIFTREMRWWCQNYDILTFWRSKTSLSRQTWRQIS